MKKQVVAVVLLCVPAGVLAWQGGMAGIGVTESALQPQLERVTRQKGDGLTLSILGPKQLLAAKALSPADQAVLMKELATAAKAIVMTPAFLAAHDAWIAKEYQAVNHGLKVKSADALLKGATTEAGVSEMMKKIQREAAAVYVQMTAQPKIADLKMMFDESLKDWTKDAARAKGTDKTKYTKIVARAEAIKDVSVSDEARFRRTYAVLLSAAADGPDTEEAVFGASASSKAEAEQQAWDKYNLRGALKRVLAQAIAEAPTVDFAAATVQKSGVRVFVNPAYEKKSLTWKAMYRAGKLPTAAGLEIARAWLKEL
jgi:hypothetical protein